VIRKVIKNRKLFPSDDSAKKVIYLAVQEASKKWTMPIGNWKTALNRFMIELEDCLADFV
jgi:putative transposase